MTITHHDIHALCNYLLTHSSDALLLAEALKNAIKDSGKSTGDDSDYSQGFINEHSAECDSCRWLTLSEVAERVGVRSAGWVRHRLCLISADQKQQQSEGLRQWFVREDAVTQLIDIRLRSNAKD